jgi:hypothetical protein
MVSCRIFLNASAVVVLIFFMPVSFISCASSASITWERTASRSETGSSHPIWFHQFPRRISELISQASVNNGQKRQMARSKIALLVGFLLAQLVTSVGIGCSQTSRRSNPKALLKEVPLGVQYLGLEKSLPNCST